MSYDIGPKIGIEGEAEFRQAINGINTNLKTLGTEMMAVTSKFDKNEKSTEALTAKNEVLNKQIDVQKNKLSELTKGLDMAATKYGENDKVTQGWRQAVNKATADLNNMERELDSNSKAMNETESATKDMANSLDDAGKKALSFGDILKANVIGSAIVDGVKALGSEFKDLASSALDSADSIQQMADQTGMSAEVVQEWQFVGDTLGTSIDTITGAQAKLTKSMSAASDGTGAQADAFSKLGISVTDNSGNLRDAKTVMLEAFDALGKVGNETERDALAMSIFGKSAMDLNPLIKAGSDEISNLTNRARETGAVMSNESVAGLDNFGDSIGQLKQSATAMAGTILSELTPSLEPLIEKVKTIDVTPIINALKFIIDNAGTIIAAIGGIGAGLLTWNVISMVMGLVEAIKAFQLANEGATIAQAALNLVLNANPIGIVVTAIAALTAGIIVLWNTNEDFRNAVITAWENIKKVAMNVFGWIKNFLTIDIPKAFNNAKNTVINTFESIKNINWAELGWNIISGIATGVANAAKNLANSVVNAAKGALDAAKDFLGIQSPSTVMRDQVGKMIGAGMAVGITDSARQVDAAMNNLNEKLVVDSSVKAMNTKFGQTSSNMTNNTDNRNIVINQYNTVRNDNDIKKINTGLGKEISKFNRAIGVTN